jgi:hypothetical protein
MKWTTPLILVGIGEGIPPKGLVGVESPVTGGATVITCCRYQGCCTE